MAAPLATSLLAMATANYALLDHNDVMYQFALLIFCREEEWRLIVNADSAQ
jgi:hypothetical protein